MAAFFSKYPKVIINNRLVTDIIARSTISEKYSDKLSIYYPYDLQEGDTPEIIASKYYGDPERHWLVLLANQIINPFFDFCLDYQVFDKHIENKYKEQANSINLWANSTWCGEWASEEYAIINGIKYSEGDEAVVTYNEDRTIEYIHNSVTGEDIVVIENSPQDIDVLPTYYTGNTVVISNTAFYCIQQHDATVFSEDLAKNYWLRIQDGSYWRGDWATDTEYNIDDVTAYNGTIYICTENNTSNSSTGLTVSNANYWKTYNNAVEYANVTLYGYRANIITTDGISGESSTQTFYIDKDSYIGNYINKDLNPSNNTYLEVDNSPIFNYAGQTVSKGNITVTTEKEPISIYQYELEQNESKRQIKLIRKEYATQIEQEFKQIMGEYYG